MTDIVRIGGDADIERNDVINAIAYYNSENMTSTRAKSGFFLYDGKEYPARRIGILALSIRDGIDPKNIFFHGGEYAVRYMEKLGFAGKYVRNV